MVIPHPWLRHKLRGQRSLYETLEVGTLLTPFVFKLRLNPQHSGTFPQKRTFSVDAILGSFDKALESQDCCLWLFL